MQTEANWPPDARPSTKSRFGGRPRDLTPRSDTWQRHYLTAADLQKYYLFYKDCPVRSFSTQGFDFEKMPLARYYISDFAEVTERFSLGSAGGSALCVIWTLSTRLTRFTHGHMPWS